MDYNNYQHLMALGQMSERVHVDPRLTTNAALALNETPSLLQKYNAETNQQFVNTWLLEKGKLQPGIYLAAGKSSIKKSKNEIPISVAKSSLRSCLGIIQKLDETHRQLCDSVETMSSAEWKQKSLEIGYLRDELDKLMLKFEDKESLAVLKINVKKRLKKRLNQKRRKQARKEEKAQEADNRQKLHKSIDQWLESKKDETERIKMDEKLKKDADCVLYEVTKKKSDARKHLSLISALVKLRTVRDNMATQRGEKLSLEDRRAFGSVTEKLIRMWENACQNYAKEEQCLRLMLEHNASEDSKAMKKAKEGSVVEEWERLLFGSKHDLPINNPTYWALTNADRDLETFIAIRKSWDTFLTKPTNKLGSSIPVGWVIPPAAASVEWTKYLKK